MMTTTKGFAVWLIKWWLVLIPSLFFPGCSFLAPGFDTRMAALSRNNVTWDAQGNLNIVEDTTHERITAVAEGEGVKVFVNPDGTITIEGATAAMAQRSDPESVMAAYIALAQENAKVAGKIMDSVQQLVGTIAPILAARGVEEPERMELPVIPVP